MSGRERRSQSDWWGGGESVASASCGNAAFQIASWRPGPLQSFSSPDFPEMRLRLDANASNSDVLSKW